MKPLFALFIRSIRHDARSTAFVWARTLAAIGVLLVLAQSHGVAPGLTFFTSLVAMNAAIICLAAISYFAAAITEEKEEGMLGVLRLTDLSPFSILLGKSTSKLIGGMLLLIVQMPFAMLAITVGGVRADQVIDCYLLLGGVLFLACNAGLLASVVALRTAGAGVLTASIMGLFFAWPLIVDAAFGIFAMATGSWDRLVQVPKHIADAFSVPMAFTDVLGSRISRRDITASLGILLAGGLACFLIARLLFSRFCSEEVISAVNVTRETPRKSGEAKREREPGRAWTDAVCWRDFYFLHGGKKAIFLKALVYLALTAWVGSIAMDRALMYFHHVGWWYEFSFLVFGSAVGVTLFESLFANSRIYRLEQKERTLAALHILPQRLEELLLSKRRAVFLSLAPGLFFVAAAFLAVFAPLIAYAPEQVEWMFLGVVYLVLQIVLNHYLVGWLSLVLRWGALPLALGISVIVNYLTLVAARPLLPWSLLALIAGASCLNLRLRRAFRRALITGAAEG